MLFKTKTSNINLLFQTTLILVVVSCTKNPDNNGYDFSARNDDIEVFYNLEKNNDEYTISGVIKDVETHNATQDIFNIILVGHRIGTINKEDGTFSLKIPKSQGKIKMYYLGRDTLIFDYHI